MSNCSTGYSADILLRIPMPYGPFNEPLGTDCYLNEVGFKVLASIVIIFALSLAIILIFDIIQRNHLPFTFKVATFFSISTLLNTALVALFGIFLPQLCFAVWVSFSFFLLMFLLSQARHSFYSIILTMHHLTNKPMVEIIGGKVFLGLSIILILCCVICIMVGAIGTAIFAHNSNSQLLSLMFWQTHCAGWCAAVLFSVVVAQIFIRQFIRIVEEVTQNIHQNQDQTLPPNNNHPQLINSGAQRSIQDLLKRLHQSRGITIATLPVGCSLWMLHILVIPAFWYLLILHLFNAIFAVFGIWYVFTPHSQKLKMWKMFTISRRTNEGDDVNWKNNNSSQVLTPHSPYQKSVLSV